MAAQAATARLALDASGFDKQANASFREFSKQLTSVKDATDVAMRGAEALQKVFVKSLGGTIAIGAANALADSMRDISNSIGSAADAASQATSGMTGFSGSLEEAAARAQTLSAASNQVRKSIEELSEPFTVKGTIFALLEKREGRNVLQDLEESTKGLAGLELLTGLQQGNRTSQKLLNAGPGGQDAVLQSMANEKARRDLQSSAAFRGADPATRNKIMAEFEKKLKLDESLRNQKEDAKTRDKLDAEETKKLEAHFAGLDKAEEEKSRKAEQLEQKAADERMRLMQEEFKRRMENDRIYEDARMKSAMDQVKGSSGETRASGEDRLSQLERDIGDSNDSRAVGFRQRLRRARQKNARSKSQEALKSFDRQSKDAGYQGNTQGYMEKLLADPGGQVFSGPLPAGMVDPMQLQMAAGSMLDPALASANNLGMRNAQPFGLQAPDAGGKTLTDIHTILQDTLNKLTAAPLVGGN